MNQPKNKKTRRDFGVSGAGLGMAALAALTSGAAAGAEPVDINAMGPTTDQAQAFANLPSDRPVVMLNLLKFKDAGAYQTYGIEVGKILSKIGAEVVFSGECQGTLIGGAEWDAAAMVRYPNAQALNKMSQSAEYQAIHSHRASGLEGQMLIPIFENPGFAASPNSEETASEGAANEGAQEAESVTAEQLMSRMDTNADGKIDLDEAPEQMKASFGMLDTNADGGIDLEEAKTIADFINNQ